VIREAMRGKGMVAASGTRTDGRRVFEHFGPRLTRPFSGGFATLQRYPRVHLCHFALNHKGFPGKPHVPTKHGHGQICSQNSRLEVAKTKRRG
jgi:hypothetical protein